jgi:L-ribulose-5-phosphate 3-epimerase
MEFLVVEPKRFAQWDNLEELAREYEIKLAIHNHRIDSTYGDPSIVKKILAGRDQRIGCLNVVWVTAAGFDVAQVFRNYGDRVFDIRLKD